MAFEEHAKPPDRCQRCGTPFGAEDRFCGACGAVRRPSGPSTSDGGGVRRSRSPIGGSRALVGGAAALLLVGVGVLLLISTESSNTPHASPSSPVATQRSTLAGGAEEESTSTVTPPVEQRETDSGSTTSPTSPQSASPPVRALEGYWADIRAHDFSGAYRYLAPGAAGLSESQFVASERKARIEGAQFSGEVTSNSGSTATVEVLSLVTHDSQFGCRDWSGSYTMISAGGSWRIGRANLSPQSCSG